MLHFKENKNDETFNYARCCNNLILLRIQDDDINYLLVHKIYLTPASFPFRNPVLFFLLRQSCQVVEQIDSMFQLIQHIQQFIQVREAAYREKRVYSEKLRCF